MKIISGTVEFQGDEYDYRAELNNPGTDSWPDRILDLDRADGTALPDGVDWEAIEELALQNALLLDWCEHNGWETEDSGGGCSARVKTCGDKIIRVTMTGDPIAPQTISEAVDAGVYDRDGKLIGGLVNYPGGIADVCLV